MADTWWDSAYRGGRVPWDPGAYDGHLPRILQEFSLSPGTALDIGCGSGKSLIYLAEHGFSGTGIDLSPTALKIAERESRMRGFACHWVKGTFPVDFAEQELPAGAFDFIMERGCFQHQSLEGATEFADRVAHLLSPTGVYYSLIAADKGRRGMWGPRWSEQAVRRVLGAAMDFVALELTVFTPGERGSMGAWFCVLRRRS